jgi:hypothetical protein
MIVIIITVITNDIADLGAAVDLPRSRFPD